LGSEVGSARILVVNADDFGQSSAVNRGVIEAHRSGIVTSTSLMVRWPAAAEASVMCRAYPKLAVGLHLDLGEWFLQDGEWRAHYEVVPLEDASAVEQETERQIAAFGELMGRAPTHIDSHQHVHLREPLRSIVARNARELGVPLRRCDARVRYCGAFYGQDENGAACHENISIDALLGLLAALPEGTTELCCHPAAAQDLNTMYSAEREHELRVLCDPRVRAAIEREGIELRSFADLPQFRD
jgi:chitin disaccharide deacetylase